MDMDLDLPHGVPPMQPSLRTSSAEEEEKHIEDQHQHEAMEAILHIGQEIAANKLRWGPNWRLVAHILLQADSLTIQQARDLELSERAVTRGYRETSRRAMWGAAKMSGTQFDQAASTDVWRVINDRVGGNIAASVASNAAAAVTTRDLIGTSTYLQSDYDLLVKPWETVMGPIREAL